MTVPRSGPDLRRLWHGLRQGIATSGSAAVAHQDRVVAGAVRVRQIRPRRIAVIGSTGGAGTTTVAVLLASVLSATRDDRTLVLSAYGDPCDAAMRLGITNAPRVSDVLAGLHRHGRIPPTPVTGSGLRVLAAPPSGCGSVESGLGALMDAAVSGHACVIVDAGVAGRIADLATVAGLADTVVLVSGTSIDAVQASSAVLARWRSQTATGTGKSRLVLLPVRARSGSRRSAAELGRRLSATDRTARGLPYDPELARGARIQLDRLSGPCLDAILTLAADIMGQR